MSDHFEFQLLKALVSDKEVCHTYGAAITFSNVELSNIFEQIKLYYLHNDIHSIAIEELQTILLQLYKSNTYTSLIQDIYNTTINEEYINTLTITIYNRYIVSSIHSITKDMIEAQDFSNLEPIIDLTTSTNTIEDEEVSSLSLIELSKEHKGLSWPFEKFQQYLGLLPPSTHGLVVGPVEVGKTALITNLSLYFMKRGARVLHLNNEDPIRKLMERYYMIYWGRTISEINSALQDCSERFEKEFKGKLFVFDTAGLSLLKIDRLVKKYTPEVVLIDQLDPMINENDPGSLEKLYEGARHIAKRNNTRVISVTQASDGVGKFLQLREVHNSKVGKQGSLDYMIGIGGDPYMPHERYISLPKNKLTGRHENFILLFDSTCMRMAG